MSQGQQAENKQTEVANFTHFLILNPDDYERGRMSLYGTQSFGTLCVVYKTSGHLNGCLFNTIYPNKVKEKKPINVDLTTLAKAFVV